MNASERLTRNPSFLATPIAAAMTEKTTKYVFANTRDNAAITGSENIPDSRER